VLNCVSEVENFYFPNKEAAVCYKSKIYQSSTGRAIWLLTESNVELALTIAGISRGERRKRAKKALEEVGLGDQLHKKPNQMSGALRTE